MHPVSSDMLTRRTLQTTPSCNAKPNAISPHQPSTQKKLPRCLAKIRLSNNSKKKKATTKPINQKTEEGVPGGRPWQTRQACSRRDFASETWGQLRVARLRVQSPAAESTVCMIGPYGSAFKCATPILSTWVAPRGGAGGSRFMLSTQRATSYNARKITSIQPP